MKSHYLLLTCLLLTGGLYGQLIDPQTPGNARPENLSVPMEWELAFSDEFNDNTIDLTKWTIDDSPRSRSSRPGLGIADWFWRPDNVAEANGNLELRVDKVDFNTMHCGAINSRGKYEPRYGYYEVRVLIAEADKGTHTAFWLQGQNQSNVDDSGHDGAEIDVFESAWLQDFTKSVIHIDGYGPDRQANTMQYNTPGLHTGYHTFGMLWIPGEIKMYYDGVLGSSHADKWVPRVEEFLWLSDGASFGYTGDNFTSAAVGELTKAYFDYVRVWQLPGLACDETLIELESFNATASGANTAVTNNAGASAGAHLRLLANGIGDAVTFDLCYNGDGYYIFELSSLTFSGFGQYQASIETSPGVWETFPDILDMYSPTSSATTFIFPEVFLPAGNHQLRFTSVGKNAASANFIGSFDKLDVSISSEPTACTGDATVPFIEEEIEDLALAGTTANPICGNASGGELIRLDAVGASATLTVNVPEAGGYGVIVGYYAKAPREARLIVNGNNLGVKNYPITGNWCFEGAPPGETSFPVTLMAGDNTIAIQANTGNLSPLLDYIGVSDPCGLLAALPVQLTHFQAEPQEKSVLLSWTTVNETDNNFMAVERSIDGQHFTEIGRLPGFGSSDLAIDYELEDTAPHNGTNFYRLRQVDYDGSINYSIVVVAQFSGQAKSGIFLYPTLLGNNETLNIKLTDEYGEAPHELLVMDQLGRRMNRVVVSGEASSQVSIEGLSPGIYYLVDGLGQLPPARFVVSR